MFFGLLNLECVYAISCHVKAQNMEIYEVFKLICIVLTIGKVLIKPI